MRSTDDGLERILNSPESMKKIAEIAQALKADAAPADKGGEPEPINKRETESYETFSETDSEAEEPEVPAAGDLSQLFSGLKLSPTIMKVLSGAARGYGQNDKRTRLLEALRPFAHGGNAETIDRAIHAVKIAKTAKTVLSDFGGGDRLV